MTRIYILLCAYYLVGIIATAVINYRRKDADISARWTKLGVYVFITFSLTSALAFTPRLATAAAMLVAVTGLYELLRLPGPTGIKRVLILCGYCAAATLFCLFARQSRTNQLACLVYVVVLSFDGFSQISGQIFGGPKIWPRISPGKTYSGLAGGISMGLFTAGVVAAPWLHPHVFAIIVCLLAFAGDMIASAIKRQAGVKDYSNLIPGHGGVLDRFDSFLFVGAMLECYFRLL